jgi:hypothetical protein
VAWADESELNDSLAAAGHLSDAADMADHWRRIIPEALERARQFIVSVVALQCGDGSLAEAAPQVHAYHLALAKFFALTDERASVAGGADPESLKTLDVRDEVRRTVFTDADGVPLTPAAGSGVASAGVLAARNPHTLPASLRAAFGHRRRWPSDCW